MSSSFFPNASSGAQSALVGLLTASILLGGWIGSGVSVPLTARFGRRKALIACGAICAVASIVMGLVNNFVALVVLRTMLGLSVGMSTTLGPLYNAETVPPVRRGVVGAVFQVRPQPAVRKYLVASVRWLTEPALLLCSLQLAIVSSILLAEVVNYAFNPSNSLSISPWTWQVQFMLGAVFGVGLMLSGFFVPESGVWIQSREKKRRKIQQAQERQRALWNRRMSRNEEEGMDAEAEEAEELQRARSRAPAREEKGWRGLCRAVNSRWVLLAVILAAGSQLTGINTIMFYAPRIFTDAGYKSKALVLTIGVVSLHLPSGAQSVLRSL